MNRTARARVSLRRTAVATSTSLVMLTAALVSPNAAIAADSVSTVSAADVAVIQKIFGPGGKAAGQGLTIPVGTLLAMTGPGAFVGQVMSRGEILAAAQIKAAGGPDFKLQIVDHLGGDVQAGVSGARRIIDQEKVPVMLSSYGGVTQAIAPLVAQSKVLTFNGGGPDPTQSKKDYLWLPANYYGDVAAPGSLAYLLKKYPKAKKLQIIGSMENGVNAMKNLVPKYWKQLGGKVVGTEINKVGQTDFTQMVARIKAKKPDVIWTDTFGDDMGYLMKALKQGGVKVPVMGSELSPNACKIAGSAYQTFSFAGSYFDPNAASNPWASLFAKSYKQAFNQDAEYYGGTYYEDMFIIWELVKRVIASGGNPMSGTALQAALVQKPTFKTILGGTIAKVDTLSMNVADHSGARPMGIYGVKNCVAVKIASITAIKPGQKPASTLVN